MNIDEIIKTHEKLECELRTALATMERSDKIFEIKKQMIANQSKCPHFSDKYNWTIAYGKCPYCGFVLDIGGNV
jgi:hypothetical protein